MSMYAPKSSYVLACMVQECKKLFPVQDNFPYNQFICSVPDCKTPIMCEECWKKHTHKVKSN